MTAANEFIVVEEGLEDSSPVVMGVPLTPKNIGIAIAVAGILLAGFAAFKLVMPTIAKGNELNSQITSTQTEIEQQEERLSKKAEAEQQLAEAQQRRAAVTALFADEATLETLMFDIQEQVNTINAGIAEDNRKATIVKFQPILPEDGEGSADGIEKVDDGSLGAAVDGKLRRRRYEVEFEGSFAQTRQFLIILERMQPMLVVRNLSSELVESKPILKAEYQPGKVIPASEQPQRRVTTSFTLSALMPLSQEQRDAAVAADTTTATPENPPQ